MQSLFNCVAFLQRYEGRCETFKVVRNKCLNGCEKVTFMLNVVLFLLGLTMTASGIYFFKSLTWENVQFTLKAILNIAKCIVIIYSIVIPVFACLGIVVVRWRTCHAAFLIIYGVFAAFISIPLISEGCIHMTLDRMSQQDLQVVCQTDLIHVFEKYSVPFMAIMETSHRFDLWQRELLDKYMCTEVCPCLEYETTKGNTKNIFMQNIDRLEKHNRTFTHI